MKKLFVRCCSFSIVMIMSSCYSTTFCVGDISPTDPALSVKTTHNAHFLVGLVNGKEVAVNKYVAGEANYKIKHYRSIEDYFLSFITLGIYTPTTTTFYLPVDKAISANKNNKEDE